MNPVELEKAIDSADFYTAESLRAVCQIASEIMRVKDKITRHALMNRFERKHGRKCAVWSKVVKRFPTFFDSTHTHYQHAVSDTYRALAAYCQLPLDDCAIESSAAVLDEPNCHMLAYERVNEIRGRKRTKRERTTPLADRVAQHIYKNDSKSAAELIAEEPEVLAALERATRERMEKAK